MIGRIDFNTGSFSSGRENSNDDWGENFRKSLGERIDKLSENTDTVRLSHQLDALARKVARGDEITINEKRFLIEKDAERLNKAEWTHHSKSTIEARLKPNTDYTATAIHKQVANYTGASPDLNLLNNISYNFTV